MISTLSQLSRGRVRPMYRLLVTSENIQKNCRTVLYATNTHSTLAYRVSKGCVSNSNRTVPNLNTRNASLVLF